MNWWYRVTHRRKMENQLDKELAFHIEELADDLMARGHTPAEARRLARIELGGPEQVKEDCRDARGTRWVEDFFQDVRYAVRTLRQKPGFAAVALLSLALGTGATTVMFSLIDGVMLKPFAYRDPSHLFRLWEQTDYTTLWGNTWLFTYPDYLDSKDGARSLDIAVWHLRQGTLSAPGPPEYESGVYVSPDLFSLLGANAALGRTFRPQENRPGAEPVAVISDHLWRQRFAGRRDVLGTHLIFDGQPYTIVGVMPPAFRLEDEAFEVFTPVGQVTSGMLQWRRRGWSWLRWDAGWRNNIRIRIKDARSSPSR